MKTLIALLFFTFALAFTSCGKEKTSPSEYITYKVQIVSPRKQIPLANYNLLFFQRKWIDYRTIEDTIMGYATTDKQGNASFTFKTSAIIDKPIFKYRIENHYIDSISFDSTNVNFRYIIFLKLEENNNKIIEAYNICSLRVTLAQEKYMAMGIDSLYLETPFEKYVNKDYTELYYIFGNLECSENVPLKYYYYVKGVKSKEYTKNIFISRSNPFKAETVYELEFY